MSSEVSVSPVSVRLIFCPLLFYDFVAGNNFLVVVL